MLVTACVAVGGAIVLGGLAVRSGDSAAGSVVLEAETAVASSLPVTVPTLPESTSAEAPPTIPRLTTSSVPQSAPPSTSPSNSATDTSISTTTITTTTSSTTTSTIPVSPLAELLGDRGSAAPPAVEPRNRPVALAIDELELLAPVRPVGLEDDGQLEVPDETEVGWYQYGAAPGRAGSTVLAAHVSWNRTTGPFHDLGDLEPGASVLVVLDDETTRTYQVIERTIYDKDELPRDRIWRNSGDESLVLITCGGDYNPDIRRYRQNIVVYAVPVA